MKFVTCFCKCKYFEQVLIITFLLFINCNGLFSKNKPICLIINSSYQDLTGSNAGEPAVLESETIMLLKKGHPNVNFIIVRENIVNRLNNKLKNIVNNNTEIECLAILSHGASGRIQSQKGDFNVFLNDEMSIKAAFHPIIGKFKKNAKIIFEGCNVTKFKSVEERTNFFRQVAKSFSLQSGTIYANRTYSYRASAIYFKSRFQCSNFKALILGAQILSPISYPLVFVSEKILNRGYSFNFNEDVHSMVKDDFYSACKRKVGVNIEPNH